jgi:hypothetical protein
MADQSLLAQILSGQDPLAAQMLPAYQGSQLSNAALDPSFGHNEGPFGALAKTIAGFSGGNQMRDAVQALVQARNANRPELAQVLASPDPFKAVADNPNLSPLTQAGILNGATPNTVAEARLHAMQQQFLQSQIGQRNQFGDAFKAMLGGAAAPGIAALGAVGTGGAPAAATNADTINAPANEVSAYVTQAAEARGIDPAVPLKIFSGESSLDPTLVGDGGTSFGVPQLHVTPGGKGNAVGDQFVRDTGLDPADPKNWKAAVDYSLDHAAKNGWNDWSVAKNLGIPQFAGIGAPGRVSALRTAAPGGGASPPMTSLASAGGAALAATPDTVENTPAEGMTPAAQGYTGKVPTYERAPPTTPSIRNLQATPLAVHDAFVKYRQQGGQLPIEQFIASGGGRAAQAAPQQPQPASPAPGAPAPASGAAAPNLGLGSLTPRNIAILGAMAQNAGIGDVMKPIETYVYNSPEQKAAVARAEDRAKLQKLGPSETLLDPANREVVAQTPKAPEFSPHASLDPYNRPQPGIVTYGTGGGGTVTPTQVGGGDHPAALGMPGARAAAPSGMLEPGQIKQNEAQGEANVKRSEALYTGIQQQSAQFQRDMNPYLQLSKSILNTPGMYSGAAGHFSLDINRVKAALGDTNAAMMQEALGKVTAQSVLSQINNQRAQMQEGGNQSSRIFSQQVELVEKAAPAMVTTLAGNRFLVNVAERMGNLSNTVAEMARDYKMQHGILDAGFDKQLADYMKTNPVFTKQELEHPHVLGAPNVPSSIQSPGQLKTWAESMGVHSGDPIRLEDGSVKALP